MSFNPIAAAGSYIPNRSLCMPTSPCRIGIYHRHKLSRFTNGVSVLEPPILAAVPGHKSYAFRLLC
jgi:hypothetical protein